MSKAYVLESVKHDIQCVTDYAPIEYLFSENERRPSIFSTEYAAEVIRRLDDSRYDPQADYIVIAGNVIGIATAVGILCCAYGAINTLVFDGQKRSYVQLTMGSDDMEGGYADEHAA